MKQRRTKTILSAIVMMILSLTIISGSTFALFTDSEQVDVTVKSGRINVEATVDKDSFKLYSMDEEQPTVDGKGTFANGGTAEILSNSSLVLDRVTPGDKVTFDINLTNDSNVSISYRVLWNVSGDLAKDLTVTADGKKVVNSKGIWTAWDITEGDTKTVNMAVELPKEKADCMDKEAVITYAVEVIQANAAPDSWDGTLDTSWFDVDNYENQTTYRLNSAEQLMGLSNIVDNGVATIGEDGEPKTLSFDFTDKEIILEIDVDLGVYGEDGELICFDPIGSYRNDQAFRGTFDGNGHTISNLYQNTWALNNGYYYGDLGLGLFGMVEDATIKNLNVDNASISGESAICGVVAATAYGNCTFENITVSNTKCNDYQYYAGGVVGWASGDHVYKNVVVDESTTIGGQWGDFGNANGGIIGGCGSSAELYMEDCIVACRIDAVNDVVSAYQWYCYRNSGMLIGKTTGRQYDENGNYYVGPTEVPNLTCKNVEVIYGDWANYTYCEFAGTSYPYVRVQAGVSVDAYSNVRYGHPTDANGNTVVDDNHVHNDGEKHHELIAFDQLFGGAGNARYCNYGIATHEGVTVTYNNK